MNRHIKAAVRGAEHRFSHPSRIIFLFSLTVLMVSRVIQAPSCAYNFFTKAMIILLEKLRKYSEENGMGKKKDRVGRFERLCRRFDIPCDVLPWSSLVTVRGRGQVTVEGSRRILEYTREVIRISLGAGQVIIRGRELECVSYGSGQISAEGIVDSVSFCEENET